jgi:ubiquitin-conjugating enzyme E2 I
VKQVLLGIQQLLDEPNNASPAQEDAFHMYRDNREAYDLRVVAQAQSMTL